MWLSSIIQITLLSSQSSGFTIPVSNTFTRNYDSLARVQRRTNGLTINMAEPQKSLDSSEKKNSSNKVDIGAKSSKPFLFEVAYKLPLVGAVIAVAGARSALQIREAVKEEQEMELEAAKKASEEQDARNRAAAASKKKISNIVSCPYHVSSSSYILELQSSYEIFSCISHS